MIVYRNHREQHPTSVVLRRIFTLLDQFQVTNCSYQDAVELLIETAEFETGLTDHYCRNLDLTNKKIGLCRNITINAASMVVRMWNGDNRDNLEIKKTGKLLEEFSSSGFPERIEVSIPEGFVYYGLYPETYMQAAEEFYNDFKPETVVCIGLRTIGTALSAIVECTLCGRGCEVRSFTVRPRGDPFDRYIEISGDLEKSILENQHSIFVLVDEGPGLSGSSIAGTFRKLRQFGIPRKNIALFTSWIPDGSAFFSEYAKAEWPLYKKYSGNFEKQWIESKRLEKEFKCKITDDISAGNWRYTIYNSENEFPAVHNQHERRKYLVLCDNQERSVLKFAGLGRYGKRMFERAGVLEEFSPSPLSLKNGFLQMKFIDGKPMAKVDIEESFIKRVVGYLAFVKNHFRAEPIVSFDEMTEMISVNITEGLGKPWIEKLNIRKRFLPGIYGREPVAVDGHMMPHEWIKTESGYIKTDSIEHHSDQFFHGCQDIAWDIAGSIIEFGLNGSRKKGFVDLCKEKIDNRDLEKRIDFYIIAYLAYRLGFVTLAAVTLSGTNDGKRFLELKDLYASLLKKEISR
jgi:hypothetical protein